MIKVITNALGTGDWIRVRGHADTLLWEGHQVKPRDLHEIIDLVVRDGCQLIETTDEGMEAE